VNISLEHLMVIAADIEREIIYLPPRVTWQDWFHCNFT